MSVRGFQWTTLIGNLGENPDLRSTAGPNPVSVCNFSLAVNEKIKVGTEYQDHAEWFKIVAWRKLADNAGKYLKKGSRVQVCGRWRTNEWTDPQGQKHAVKELHIQDMTFLDPPDSAGQGEQKAMFGGQQNPNAAPAADPYSGGEPRKKNSGAGGYPPDDEDLPF